MTRRPRLLAALGVLIVAVFVVGILIGSIVRPTGAVVSIGEPTSSPGAGNGSSTAVPTPSPTPVPTPGHEVYGFVPYWEMDASMPAHLAGLDVTTLALFSVTNRTDGSLDTAPNGYKRIVGAIGSQIIHEAHDRGTRVELVFTSFGTTRNKRLFSGSSAAGRQKKLIGELVGLVDKLGVDGMNVDVEQIDDLLIPAYGDFVGRLRTALRAAHATAQVSVATTANERGAAMALAATNASADRIFLMGYDYHWSGSAPGASAPIDRRDGEVRDLVWSLDLYQTLGIPVEKTLLGLPLYGMAWRVVGPELGAAQTGKGQNWIPSDHLDFLADPANIPTLDPIEQVEQYTIPAVPAGASPPGGLGTPVGSTGPIGSGSPVGSAGPGASPIDWTAIYVDSPATLAPKLALADARGLAGAGFWALGYERGLPGYGPLVARFRAGALAQP
jgi:Glycosyl hydrolases family 18